MRGKDRRNVEDGTALKNPATVAALQLGMPRMLVKKKQVASAAASDDGSVAKRTCKLACMVVMMKMHTNCTHMIVLRRLCQ